MRDVAAAAAVSITTVSDALSGKGRLPEETRMRVRDVARRLGYRPNGTARSLASGTTGILALSVSSAGGMRFTLTDFDYFVQLFTTATQAAFDRGYALVLASQATNIEAWERVNVDGAVVVDPILDDPVLRLLRERRTPMVTTGRDPSGGDGHWVDNDHFAATRKVLAHLAGRGARRIALVTAPPVQSYTIDAVDAYERWCAENGAEPLVEVARETLTESAGFDAAARLLETGDPPDAIYATLDRPALGVLLYAHARGVSVPRDLLVAGLSDSHAARTARPPLTALSLQPDELGRRAIDLLLDVVERRESPIDRSLVPTRLVARSSTLAAPLRRARPTRQARGAHPPPPSGTA